MEGSAVAVCEILKYLIIHWKCETGVSNGALLEGQLVISMEALNSNHQENTLHCVTTIASAGSTYGGLVLKKFIKEIQSILPGFSAKLNWTSEEASSSQDISGVTPFQMIFEVDEKPRTLMTDSLVIKNFLRRIIMVHPKAADTQEFGTKLHKSFHEITQHRFLPHCSCEVKQQLLPEKNAEQSTEDAHENSSPELLTGTSEQVENKRLKRGSLRRGMEETQAFHSARAPSQLEAAARRTEPAGAFPTSSGSRASHGGGLEDSLWLQEVSNLSEWLDPGPEP